MSDAPPTSEFSPALLEAITTALAAADRPLRASEIARAIDAERGDVNRVLYRILDRFEKVEGSRWRLGRSAASAPDSPEPPETQRPVDEERPASSATPDIQPPASATMPTVLRRPGPFGPARDLLPRGQQVRYAEHDDPVSTAIDTMLELNFTHLPVRRDVIVVGILGWRGIARHLGFHQDAGTKIAALLNEPVSSFMDNLDGTHFVTPDQFIDNTVDWPSREFVLVGSPDQLLGILTISDVWSSLNRFAEAFVILHELELALRDLIAQVAGDELEQWFDSIASRDGTRRPASLEQLQFSEYTQLITNATRWPRFAPRFGAGSREVLFRHLEQANQIRNAALHFRDEASPSRIDALRQLLDRVRRAFT